MPHYRRIVAAALQAGKHVFCEWPLGNGLAEAEELAALARSSGLVAVAGPEMAMQLISSGATKLKHLVMFVVDADHPCSQSAGLPD